MLIAFIMMMRDLIASARKALFNNC